MLATLDPVLIAISHFAVALLFLFAAVAKLHSFGVFRATLADYQLVPERLLSAAAVLVVLLELMIVLGAMFAASARISMLVAIVLLAIYATAIGINLLRGRRDIDCGCTGPASQQLLSPWLLLRNIGLMVLAFVGTASSNGRAMLAADWVLVGLALIAAIVFYSAINQLMANAPRLDALDDLLETA